MTEGLSREEFCQCEVIEKSHCPTCGLRRQPVISQETKEQWARRIAEMTDAASLHQRFNYQEYIDAVVALMTNKGEKIKTASPRP